MVDAAATGRALAGVTVVVTRQEERAGELAALLREKGANVVSVPLIEIVMLDCRREIDDAVGALTPGDWVVVTSAYAADALASTPAFASCAARVAAVGPATAERLSRVDLVPQRANASGLVEEMPASTGCAVVLQAQGGAPTLADGLTAKRWRVQRIDTHVARPRVPDAGQQLALLRADAVVFTSGSQAKAWAAVLGSATPPIVVTIGPQTAADAEAVGIASSAVSDDHSLRGVIAALERAVAR